MRKFIFAITGALLLGTTVHAQQIKGDFDKQTDWGVQTSFSGPDPSFTDMGITPDGWSALNVTQMGLNFPLVFGDAGMEGSGKSVKMMNRKLGAFGIGANSPSYITLGTTWVYADILGVMSQLGDKSDPDDSNGGSLGGIDFNFRPDSISGYFKRSHGTQNPDEIAQIIVYSWIGTSKSYSPVGDGMDLTENLPKEALVDRDIDILGIQNNGKPANGITLIGKQMYSIEGNLPDWTRISVPIEYQREENPMKLNVIISSADYFNRSNIGTENQLWADNVRFIYNSKLKSITIDGKALDGFDEDTLTYVLPQADASKTVAAKAFGKNANVTIGELKDSQRTITVEDLTAAGVKKHVYTLIYKGAPAELSWKQVSTEDCVYGNTIDIKPVSANTEGLFSYEISNTDLAEIADGNQLHFKGVGEVKITARQAAGGEYSPSVSEPLVLNIRKAPLVIGVKDIERKYNYSDDKFEFVYEGLKNDDAEHIDRVFTVKPVVSIPEQTLPNGKILKTTKGVYVGEYVLTVSGATAVNYEPTYTTGTLTVTPAAPIVIGIKAASVDEGSDLPVLTVDYSKLIGEDKLDHSLVFSAEPTLKTSAVKGSPAGTYDILFDAEGTLTEAAKKNYESISYAEKGVLTIKAIKTQPAFEDLVSKVEGLPEKEYVYAGYTDILGRILVYDKEGNLMDPDLLTFSTNSNSAFGIEKNGDYRLWGSVNGATGDVEIKVTVKETETTLPVTEVVGHTLILKKEANIRPKDFALSAGDFIGNMGDAFPIYIQSEEILERDLDAFGMLGVFVTCPTLNIETPDGILKLEVDPESDYKNSFKEEAVEKLHQLPTGKYSFTLEGGESTQYAYNYDNTVKGVMLVPGKSTVEIKGIDNLVYGRKEPFKIEIEANGSPITEYTITKNFIQETDAVGEYKVLSVGTDTITFTIPATEQTIEETCVRILTVNKATLIVTPEDIICKEGSVVIPETYEFKYEGFVNEDNASSLDVLPIGICQVTETAKEGEVFTIFATGAEDDHYDFVYREGKFMINGEQGITNNTADGKIRVLFTKGNLVIQGNEDALPIAIYNLQGVLVANFDGRDAIIPVALSGHGIYIVRIGNYASKIVID